MEASDLFLTTLCVSNNLINLINNNTCFSGIGFCTDLILTTGMYSFRKTRSSEKTLIDHYFHQGST